MCHAITAVLGLQPCVEQSEQEQEQGYPEFGSFPCEKRAYSRTGPVLSHSHLRVKCGEAVKKYLNKNKNKNKHNYAVIQKLLGVQNNARRR